jgi:hypothetical protein
MATESGQAKASANQQPVSLWAAAEPTQGTGSGLGGTHREDDHESVDGWDFAHQVHRIGQRRLKCFPHKPEPGARTRRHIKNPFKAGATVEEIMEVLKLGVV